MVLSIPLHLTNIHVFPNNKKFKVTFYSFLFQDECPLHYPSFAISTGTLHCLLLLPTCSFFAMGGTLGFFQLTWWVGNAKTILSDFPSVFPPYRGGGAKFSYRFSIITLACNTCILHKIESQRQFFYSLITWPKM